MEKIWLASYPPGVPEEIDPDAYPSLTHLLDESCSRFADKPAFSNMGKTITYSELDESSKAFAAYLQHAMGLKKGDRVAIMMPNLLQYPVALFAVLRAGGTVVNVNPLYTPRELAHQLKDSGAKIILILANFAHVLEKALPKTDVETIIITEIGDMLGFPKRLIVNFAVKRIKKMVPHFELPGAIPFSEVISTGATKSFEKVDITGNDLAFLQYTGGTTGVSKGAILTHRNLVANLEQNAAWWAGEIDKHGLIMITALPLYHIYSLTCNCLFVTRYGGVNVLITNPRDVKGMVAEMAKWDVTMMTGVNTLYNALLNHESFRKLDFSTFRHASGGGMAVQKAVAERWQAVTGTTLLEGYGLTEASPVVSANPPQTTAFSGTIGLPLPSTEISLRDEEGNEVPLGEPGELCVRGPQVMSGYWQKAEETNKTLTDDGWLMTGDIATMDERGYLRIVDRKKDMILVSGFNVFPNEIEDVVAMHAGVREVGCVGVPDPKSGQAVKVFVVPSEKDALTSEEIREHCKEHLTGYKVPKHVEFREDLPKTNVGKILRRALTKYSK